MVEKSDEQILFDEVEIGKYKIVPWSFGVLFSISVMIDEIFLKLEEKNIDIAKEMADIADSSFINFSFIARLFSVCAPQLRKIVAITLNTDEEEVNAMDMKTGIEVTTTILRQNFDVLKNAISSSLPELKATIKEEDEEMGEEEKSDKKA